MFYTSFASHFPFSRMQELPPKHKPPDGRGCHLQGNAYLPTERCVCGWAISNILWSKANVSDASTCPLPSIVGGEMAPSRRCARPPPAPAPFPGGAAPASAASAELLAGGQAISASRRSPDSICSSSAIYSTSGQKQGASSINITLICKDIFTRLDRLMLHRAFKGCGDKQQR